MDRLRTIAAALGVLALAACQDATKPVSPVASPEQSALAVLPADAEVIPDQYIVVFKPGVANHVALAQKLLAAHGGTLRFRYDVTKGFAGRMPAAAAAIIARHPDVALVEQDQVVHLVSTQTNPTWGLDRIDQHNLPVDASYSYNATGAGVTAYIIDTGILFSHSEFGGRAVTGIDEVTANGTATDCNGHGTHVSGTVGGSTYGVAKNVNLVAVRVLDCGGSGSLSAVIAGIDWVTANHRSPAVANMSLGASGLSASLDQAVTNSINSGVTYAIAAGNGDVFGRAQNSCNNSPADVPAAITVSATDNTDTKASWANIGTCVDIFAPGVNITSSWYTSSTATNTISGTSMATPHVAGAAAHRERRGRPEPRYPDTRRRRAAAAGGAGCCLHVHLLGYHLQLRRDDVEERGVVRLDLRRRHVGHRREGEPSVRVHRQLHGDADRDELRQHDEQHVEEHQLL